jgi:hypothetical protein
MSMFLTAFAAIRARLATLLLLLGSRRRDDASACAFSVEDDESSFRFAPSGTLSNPAGVAT